MDHAGPLADAERLAVSMLAVYPPHKMRWHYEDGLFLMALVCLGRALDDEGVLLRKVKEHYDTLVYADGTIATYRKDEFNLDQINAGRVLFDLLHAFGEAKYRTAIEVLRDQLRKQPRTHSGGYWHKQIYPWQIWLDGLYMAGPFQVRYGVEFYDQEAVDDIVAQLQEVEEKVRDHRTGLLYHAWDESRQQLWADPATGRSPHFWGRAMGWYCMALTDILDYLPTSHPQRSSLIAIVERTATAVMAFQESHSGLWCQVLDQSGRQGNYSETSASAMFCYFLLKAARLGYLSAPAQAREAACKAYRALCETRLSTSADGATHLDGICSVAGLGGKPYRNGSYAYYVGEPVVSDDFKGVGPFLLASIEMAY